MMPTQPYTASADDWALHLARFVATIRPDWQVPGIRAAIHATRTAMPTTTTTDLAAALIELTRRDDLRTPAMLADDGPHWHTGRTPDARPRRAYCQTHDHEAIPCRWCRADQIAGDGPSDPPAWTPSQAAINEAGARRVRAALDTARRSAGEREDEDA